VQMLQQRYFIDHMTDARGSPEDMRKQRFRRGSLTRAETGWASLWEKGRRVIAWTIGLLALVGVFVSIRRPEWQSVTIFFLYTWLIHFPTHSEPRYLAPAYGAAMLLAALALHEGTTRIGRAGVARSPSQGASLSRQSE
jgi:hypothetical protein